MDRSVCCVPPLNETVDNYQRPPVVFILSLQVVPTVVCKWTLSDGDVLGILHAFRYLLCVEGGMIQARAPLFQTKTIQVICQVSK